MYIESGWFSLFYELTRFFLFILLVTHCFKSFIFPSILALLQEKEQEQEELNNKKELLTHNRILIEEKIAHQKTLLLSLERKISLWNSSCHEDEERKHKELEDLAVVLGEKKQLQRKILHNGKAHTEALDKAVENVHVKCNELYSKNQGNGLLATMINHLNKKSTRE